MIQKVYEVTCDYCLTAIWHGICSKSYTIAQVKENYGFVKGQHHFCDKECYNKWLQNGKLDILYEK